MSNRRKATPAELEFITAAREGDRDRLHDALDRPRLCGAASALGAGPRGVGYSAGSWPTRRAANAHVALCG